jgi:hypothetical protein
MPNPPTSLQSYEGRCHCGAIGFVYRTALAPEDWPIRACQCTFCRLHAGLTTSDPAGSLVFVVHEPAALNRYEFALKTAEFLICRNCGAYIGATMSSGASRFGIINVRVLHSLADRLRQPEPMVYDNQTAAERQARRELRWTPVSA